MEPNFPEMLPLNRSLRDTAAHTVGLDSGTAIVDQLLNAWARLDHHVGMLVDRKGKLISCSDDSQQALSAGGCLMLSRGVVSPLNANLSDDFEKLMSVEGEQVRTLLLPAVPDKRWLVRATAVNDHLACLMLHDLSKEQRVRLADVSVAFGLTKTEARICEDLYNGLSPQKIAQEHSSSIHTVRAHMRRCYDKMHITSRQELWHILNKYQI